MTLSGAIDRSLSRNETIAVEWDGGDEADLVGELNSLYDGEIDSVEVDDGTIDVWGHEYEEGDEMAWRFSVTLTPDSCDACGGRVGSCECEDIGADMAMDA